MRFGAIANSARGGPPRPPPVRDRVNPIPEGDGTENSVESLPELTTLV